jgi:hypothetical protein
VKALFALGFKECHAQHVPRGVVEVEEALAFAGGGERLLCAGGPLLGHVAADMLERAALTLDISFDAAQFLAGGLDSGTGLLQHLGRDRLRRRRD